MVLSSGKILKEAGIMADGMRKSSHPPALRHTVLLRGCVGQRSVKRGVTAGRRQLRPRGDRRRPSGLESSGGCGGRRGATGEA